MGCTRRRQGFGGQKAQGKSEILFLPCALSPMPLALFFSIFI